MAYVCNSSFCEGRDQEDSQQKPAQANISHDPVSKKPFTKKGWWSGSSSTLSSNPSIEKKKSLLMLSFCKQLGQQLIK
jgi:hypothetical protein